MDDRPKLNARLFLILFCLFISLVLLNIGVQEHEGMTKPETMCYDTRLEISNAKDRTERKSDDMEMRILSFLDKLTKQKECIKY